MKQFRLLLTLLGPLAAVAAWGQQTPITLEPVPEVGRGQTERVKANLANSSIGTRVTDDVPEAIRPEASRAIAPNKSERLQLPAGTSRVPLEMADLYSVNRTFFRSFSAAGVIRVLGSDRSLAPDSPEWTQLVPPTSFGPREFFDQDFADRTLKYIIFAFDVTTPGEISPLGLMGNEFINQASAHPPTAEQLDEIAESDKASLVPYDFASLVNGSAIALVSSGPVDGANAMIDDDITSAYEFESDDPSVTLLLDLRQIYRVNRVTLSMEAPAGTLQIYAFNVLPDQLRFTDEEGTSRRVELDSGFFDRVFPVGARTFDEPVEVAEVNFDDVDARYALLQWTPAPDVNGAADPLRIYEMSIIGLVPDDLASFRLVPSAEFSGIDPTLPGFPIPTPEPIPVEIPNPASPR